MDTIQTQTEVQEPKDSGWSFHCHHEEMLEYCTSYEERVQYIQKDKPQSQQKVRLKCFKLLSDEAVAELPEKLKKGSNKLYAEGNKLYDEGNKLYAEGDKLRAEGSKLRAEGCKLCAEGNKLCAEGCKLCAEGVKEWPKEAQEAFHKKWCGCSEWDGETIIPD